jgi:hypothetical protein
MGHVLVHSGGPTFGYPAGAALISLLTWPRNTQSEDAWAKICSVRETKMDRCALELSDAHVNVLGYACLRGQDYWRCGVRKVEGVVGVVGDVSANPRPICLTKTISD